MARFYFHWRGPGDHAPDLTGEDLPDRAAAAAAARELARRIAEDSDKSWHGWVIEVADQDGRIVETLPMQSGPDKFRARAGEG